MTANTTSIWSLGFWRASAERAIAAASAGVISLWTTDLMRADEIDPIVFLTLAAGTALLSVLKDLASTKASGTPSLVKAEVLTSDVVEKVARVKVEGQESTVVISGPANDLASHTGDVIRPVGVETEESRAVQRVREAAKAAREDMHDQKGEDFPTF